MAVVYKYELGLGRSSVTMPKGARVLHIAEQHGSVQMWACVDPDAAPEIREFLLVGTGHEFDDPPHSDDTRWEHVGTFIVEGGSFVFHVFESVLP